MNRYELEEAAGTAVAVLLLGATTTAWLAVVVWIVRKAQKA